MVATRSISFLILFVLRHVIADIHVDSEVPADAWASDDACDAGESSECALNALQLASRKVSLDGTPRASVADGVFKVGDEEVVLLGGNFVIKARPYFPDVSVVRSFAKRMAEAFKANTFEPPKGKVVPVVRLGVLFEGAMPKKAGDIDTTWAARLKETVEAFDAEGVYVLLDVHQDALSTTNGGEGLPWWVATGMQDTDPKSSYVISPEHPMTVASQGIEGMIKMLFGGKIPEIKTVEGDKDPWRAYSADGDAGDPRFMNVGNPNVRLNNNDEAWHEATILFTNQVQNVARRFFAAPYEPADRKAFFEPYMTFVKHLCGLWDEHSNVVGVELFNEPPIGGLPDLGAALATRQGLFNFYAAVLKDLDSAKPAIRAPILVEDLMGGIAGGGAMLNMLSGGGIPKEAVEQLAIFGKRNQLVWSFHYYPGVVTGVKLPEMVKLVRNETAPFGTVPLFLTEFWQPTAQKMADLLVEAADNGVNAATFWQAVDSKYTKTAGWFKYSDAVTNLGNPVDGKGNIDWPAWKEYEKTVANGTYYGADITGAEGGQAVEEVLSLMHKPAA